MRKYVADFRVPVSSRRNRVVKSQAQRERSEQFRVRGNVEYGLERLLVRFTTWARGDQQLERTPPVTGVPSRSAIPQPFVCVEFP